MNVIDATFSNLKIIMKANYKKKILVLFMFSIVGFYSNSTTAQTDRWTLFSITTGNDFYYYDSQTIIKNEEENFYHVWIKVENASKPMEFKSKKIEAKLIEIYISCVQKEYVRTKLIYLYKNGEQETINSEHITETIKPETVYEELLKKICN